MRKALGHLSLLAASLAVSFGQAKSLQTTKKEVPKLTSSVEPKRQLPSLTIKASAASNGSTTEAMPGTRLSMAPILESVLPAVVSIVASGKIQTTQQPFPDFLNFFFLPDLLPNNPSTMRAFRNSGSGVIIASDGYIVTNHHVVQHAEEFTVTLNDGGTYSAKLIGGDEIADLAVLKIEREEPFSFLPIADSDSLRVGDLVMAVGNPFGLAHTATLGMISALGREPLGEAKIVSSFIQTDASINMGNSGGALVDTAGNLVGINTSILSPKPNSGNIGIAFAIPSNLIKGSVEQLIAFGSVKRGHLGIMGKSLDGQLAHAIGAEKKQGAFVKEVLPNSPAEKAGIRAGDVITHVNKSPVLSLRDLQAKLAVAGVEKEIEISLFREGKEQSYRVRLQLDKGGHPNYSIHPALEGATLEDRAKGEPGILVKEVQELSSAAKYGLRANDLILEVNRQPIYSVEELRKLLQGKPVVLALRVKRGHGELFLVINA